MHIIKIKTIDSNYVYLNPEDISYFGYDEGSDTTTIEMRAHSSFGVEGNMAQKLAKILTINTNGTCMALEKNI